MKRAFLFLAVLTASSHAALCAEADFAAELKAKDQALLDAIAPGQHDVWERLLTKDAVYIDENGMELDRTAYLKSLVPLPPGVTGHLTIIDYSVRHSGDVALVIHRDDEREEYHGLPLRAGYLTSETWLRIGQEWRLAMVHAQIVAVEPPSVVLSAAVLDGYVGTYQAGADLTYIIRRQGNHLLAGRVGGQLKPMLAEAPDLLFTPGQPRNKNLFSRDEHGQVTGFVDRREGEDIVWRKVTPQ